MLRPKRRKSVHAKQDKYYPKHSHIGVETQNGKESEDPSQANENDQTTSGVIQYHNVFVHHTNRTFARGTEIVIKNKVETLP
jgi:hypothetical protein